MSPLVVFVSSHAKLGGAPRYLETLLTRLEREMVGEVVCLEDGPFVDRLRRHGFTTTVIPTSARKWEMLIAALKLRRLMLMRRPDVVHANGVKAALVAALALAGTRIPIVWVKHDFSWDGWLAKLVASRCRLVVGVSSAVLETFGPRLQRRTAVVYPGVPAIAGNRHEGRRALGDAAGIRDSDLVLGVVGRVDPYKGHLDVIEVVADLRSLLPTIRAVFIGGEVRSHPAFRLVLEQRAAELHVGDRCCFLGHREDATVLISGCDLVVVASGGRGGKGREGFGLVGVEAMALGVPVVGYAHGALPEVLGECAYLVAPDDQRALREAVLATLSKDEVRVRLQECGRRRVRDRYSVSRMIDGIKAIYGAAAAF